MQESLIKYRAFLKTVWLLSHQEWGAVPPVLSTHMCRYTCLFLQKRLRQDHGLAAKIVTGRPAEDSNGTSQGKFGFQDRQGNWHDHSWLVIDDQIIDLTADQFEEDEIIVTSVSDKRYRPSLDQQAFVKSFERLNRRTQKWLHVV